MHGGNYGEWEEGSSIKNRMWSVCIVAAKNMLKAGHQYLRGSVTFIHATQRMVAACNNKGSAVGGL